MILTDDWFSAMAETENGNPIFIAGRNNISAFRTSEKFKERFEIYWRYQSGHNGMPTDEDSVLIDEVSSLLRKTMEKDKLAILTGMYTGNGERTLVFYCRTARVMGERLNECLSSYPDLPLELYVENDPEWNEYAEMLEAKPLSE